MLQYSTVVFKHEQDLIIYVVSTQCTSYTKQPNKNICHQPSSFLLAENALFSTYPVSHY